MPIVWPAGLPQNMLFDGYSEKLPDGSVRTEMDAGPPKIRKRSDAGYREISGQVILTTTQVEDLVGFYEDTLSQGSVLFEWKNQITQTTAEFRFREPPEINPVSANLFRATLQLEQKTT